MINTFLSKFFGEVNFPGAENAAVGGGSYKFEDFGIYLPTLVSNYDYVDEELTWGGEENGTTETVKAYYFIIQMAWTPKTPRERFEAKTIREEALQKAEEAAAAQAAREQATN